MAFSVPLEKTKIWILNRLLMLPVLQYDYDVQRVITKVTKRGMKMLLVISASAGS